MPRRLLARVHVTRERCGGHVTRHLFERGQRLPSTHVDAGGAFPVTGLARTVIDLARTLPFDWALAVADAGLARGVRVGELEGLLTELPRGAGNPQARAVLRLADARSESAGESRSRALFIRAGLPTPRLQYEVWGHGVLLGRADFAWEAPWVLGEFDGAVKYGRLVRPGESPQDAGRSLFVERCCPPNSLVPSIHRGQEGVRWARTLGERRGRWQDGGMEIRSAVVGAMENNAYLLTVGEEGLLIDAANDPVTLLALVGDTPVEAIVTTHRHRDHTGALAAVAGHTGARLVAGTPDADAIESDTGVTIDDRVWDGDTVRVGDVELEVIGLVGHTPGSIALAHVPDDGPAHLFTGDSLFPGGVGKTSGPDAFASLLDDVEAKLFDRFDDDTVVHPGHGLPTTLGAERPHLAEWRERGW